MTADEAKKMFGIDSEDETAASTPATEPAEPTPSKLGRLGGMNSKYVNSASRDYNNA